MAEKFDEIELIKRITDSDREAFTILYSRYINGLYRYLYLFTKSKVLSEEILQDVFIKIWTRRETLQNITSFKPYLYKSAKNLVMDEIRRKQVQTNVHLALKPTSEESCEVSDGRIIYNQYYQIAQDAINLLPDKRKRIVQLRTNEELSLDEIARKLSISKNVVKKQLYAGMHFVREYLKKYGELASFLIPLLFLLDENNSLFF